MDLTATEMQVISLKDVVTEPNGSVVSLVNTLPLPECITEDPCDYWLILYMAGRSVGGP